jgi:DNA polymerase elongation subunit (family B)
MKKKLFTYSWFFDEKDTNNTIIRCYCIDENNKNVCLHISDFTPYIYLELPTNIDWKNNVSYSQILGDKIDDLLKDNKPLQKCIMYKERLYYANIDNKIPNKITKKLYPYLFCKFSCKEGIKQLFFKVKKPINISGIGIMNIKIHEHSVSPILQLTSARNIPTAGWIEVMFNSECENKITYCDYEYDIKYTHMKRIEDKNTVISPKIMSFDLEVNSKDPSRMPNAEVPEDKIFMISCIISREGQPENEYIKYLLTLGKPNNVGENCIIQLYETEADLIIGFTKLVNTENPNIIVGYNIFMFDIPYMINRSKSLYIYDIYDMLGFHKYKHSELKIIEWSSSAYKNQKFEFNDAEGRLFVDLLPLVQRDYKLDNYKLKTVSLNFLKDQTKDPLTPQGIFKCYRIGMKDDGEKGIKAMNVVGKYCIVDSVLVLNLLNLLKYWVGLCEMATICNVPIPCLYLHGQQIKVYSQIYKYCYHNNIVVEKDAYITKESDRYIGAHVFDPIPGVYNRVVPFDFCLTGDTLVTMANGCSKRIDSLTTNELVLGYNEEGFARYSTINGLQVKGKKETIKVWFQDGTTLTCTPEHKIMLDNGEWIEAKDSKDKYIKSGPEFTQDIICDKEEKWELITDDYIFNMKTKENREKSLAFARMVGFILADGSIYMNTCKDGRIRKCSEVCFGCLYDATNFKIDINKFCDNDVSIRKRERGIKGTTYCMNIPQIITNMIHSLEDIVVGKRATQAMKLPKFILDDNCPNSIIREFMAGLFGGDGTAPHLTKTDRVGIISFKWTTIENYKNEMIELFENLIKLLTKLNVNSHLITPQKIKYGENSIKPKDVEGENARWDIIINILLQDILSYQQNVGFRYCINKSYKLEIVSSYRKMCEKTRQQHSKVVDDTLELLELNSNLSTRDILNIVREDVFKNEPIINIYSMSSVSDISYQKHEAIRHADKPRVLSLQPKKFPTLNNYLSDTNTTDFFSTHKEKKYAVDRDSLSIPCFRKKVIDIKPNGIQDVYDIEVDTVHNFISNGCLTHNCSLYPSVIIAYNIDYSTFVLDETISDTLCHIFEWDDHIGCEHDPKNIRKKELDIIIGKYSINISELRKKKKDKNVELIKNLENEVKPYKLERSSIMKTKPKFTMCEKRKFRFLKEPKGVMPIVIQNLLDARVNTRKIIKQNNKEIDKLILSKEDDNKIKELKTYNVVLDKKQLAYKVSCNSISGNSPIPCRINGKIYYFNIEEINKNEYIEDKENGIEVAIPIDNLEIWSDIGFTKVKYVMRHKQEHHKLLKRIITNTGIIDCTDDHSLLREDGTEVRPIDLKIGDKLLTNCLELPKDTPKIPLKLTKQNIREYNLKTIEEKKGFLYGVFYSRGICFKELIRETGIEEHKWCISSYDIDLLIKCINIINEIEKYNFNLKILSKRKHKIKNKYYLILQSNCLFNSYFIHKYIQIFYTGRKHKRVPSEILNSSYKIRQSFFIGYYLGYINKLYRKYNKLSIFSRVYNSIKNFFSNEELTIILIIKEAICTSGIFYILQSIGYNVAISNYNNNNYTLICYSNPILENNVIKNIYSRKSNFLYKDIYVYDVETENNHFAAGIGNLIVHNSMYGIMGTRVGLLPCLPCAMCVTYMGRENINIVSKSLEKYGGQLVYGDSVTEDTPILCRLNNKIFYRTIDNISENDIWETYEIEKEISKPIENIEVWTETGFTKIKKIIRHKTDKEIFRVLTHSSVVDVTEDHGLLNKLGDKVSPKEISLGFELLTCDLPSSSFILEKDDIITIDEAYVWGMFFVEGSCGIYIQNNGQDKATWAINNQDLDILNKCKDILNIRYENHLVFKILDTIESSSVYKLVPTGKGIKDFVIQWRSLFYDKRKYKKVPDNILLSDISIRQEFMNGYYEGDGDKASVCRFDNKGKIGSAGLYYLASSLGYKVSINTRLDKADIYRMTCTKEVQRKKDVVKKIFSMGKIKQYVYDLETENHHFSAGIGKLIVHNTDSNYVHFPKLKTAQDTWKHAQYVSTEITKLFPRPISLEFEQVIYWRFFILTKKRYMYLSCSENGEIENKVGKKGVLLARRDNSKFIKNIYEKIIFMVFEKQDFNDILYFVIEELNKLCSRFYSYKDFIVTKAIGNVGNNKATKCIDEKGKICGKIGDYKVKLLSNDENERKEQIENKGAIDENEYYLLSLPAQVQLAEKMRRRGQRVDMGTRLEYLVLDIPGTSHKDQQYKKIESADYYNKHSSILKIDYLYYLKLLTNPLDQVLNIIAKKELNFGLNQYNYRYKIRKALLNEIKNFKKCKIQFV